MDLYQIVAEADAKKAFVSNQSLDFLKVWARQCSSRLEVAQQLSTHTNQITESSLHEEIHGSSRLHTLPEVVLRYLSYTVLIGTSESKLLEECLVELKQVSADLNLPMVTVVKILRSLKQDVVAFIHGLASQNQPHFSERDFSELSVEAARYCDQVIADLSQGALETAPLWQKLVNIGSQVPEEEWAKLPTDLSRNFEHYMYGAPKEG